jgi:hypothetical protein
MILPIKTKIQSQRSAALMKKPNIMCWGDCGSVIKKTSMQLECIHKSESFLCTDFTLFIDNSFNAIITSFCAVSVESNHAIKKLNNFSSSIVMHPSTHSGPLPCRKIHLAKI